MCHELKPDKGGIETRAWLEILISAKPNPLHAPTKNPPEKDT